MNAALKWWWRVAFGTVAIAGLEAISHIVFGVVPYAVEVQAALQTACILLVHVAVITRVAQHIAVEDADAD